MTENTVIAGNTEIEVLNGLNDQNGQNEEATSEEDEEAELFSDKYQSEQLDKLRTEATEAGQKMQLAKVGTKAFMSHFEAMQKAQNAIRVEIQGIKKQEAIAAQKAKEEAITNELRSMVEQFKAIAISEANGTPAEVLEGQTNEANTAFEAILNRLLGAKTATRPQGEATSQNGQNGQNGQPAHGSVRGEIEAMFIDLTAKGLNRTEAVKAIKEAGFARGSANTYVKEYLERTGQA
jgi:hypothetical protein